MKAVIINQAGGSEQLEYSDVDVPKISANQILVKNKVAGINYIDIYLRNGTYPVDKYPFILGKEGCGEIVEVGASVKKFKVGDRVAYCSANSAYAEFVALDANQAVPVPDAISDETAAAAMLQGLTAYYLTHLTTQLKADDTVLVHAGAGGVGLLLIQIAKMLKANVITTVSTPEKAALAKEAGADHCIIYTKEPIVESVMSITQNHGVNVVYDAVGKDTFFASLDCLNLRGMMVSYGQASGPIPAFDLNKLSAKSLYLTRPKLFDYIATNEELITLSKALFDLILKKGLKVQIGQRYPLKDAAIAQRDMEKRKSVAKLLLMI